MVEKTITLRFDGSVWCNLDIALRNLDQVFRRILRQLPDKLSVIEWYILRALYEQDGQHASDLANAVGRAATSFTPNLDKLQGKDLIERRPDPGDRRAVRIFLTEKGRNVESQINEATEDIEQLVRGLFSPAEYQAFLGAVTALQTVNSDSVDSD
ncbi:MAG: MarR family transcriptional regulator [Anaerolineae bacterium]|nr:MarR family transcriptional regulator [Anaerolineae bacterium]